MSLGLTSCGVIDKFEQELPWKIDTDDINIVDEVGNQSLDKVRDMIEAQEQR